MQNQISKPSLVQHVFDSYTAIFVIVQRKYANTKVLCLNYYKYHANVYNLFNFVLGLYRIYYSDE